MSNKYEVSKVLFDGSRTVVFRARRRSDGLPVVVKRWRERHPTPTVLAAFAREHDVMRVASGAGVVEALALDADEGLVLEDFGARSIAEILRERRLTIEETLRIAIQVASALARIHDLDIVHRDVNPSNVVLNEKTGTAKLIDFGIAQVLTHESPTSGSFEGTPRYASPEQTGRMHRPIDCRSDLYSFGIMLYELITGAPPFELYDRLELVHAHIARIPAPARDLEPRTPALLSEIVAILLEKEPELRYRSARGLRHDLERCLDALIAGRADPFVLRERDFEERFRLPSGLYGRERELSTLASLSARAAAGRAVTLFVAGYSGIGKTALVRETRHLLLGGLGRYCEGKYDQFRRGEPYAGFLDAVRDLVRHVLAESDDRVAEARTRIVETVGPNARVLVDLVPELVSLIGAQPDVAELPPAEARNRLQLAMSAFVRALASPDRPLVVFLDDLQWADLSSFELIERTMGDPTVVCVLFIGSYRDNEVGTDHAIHATARALERAGAHVETVHLEALGEEDVARLVSDAVLGADGHADLARICRDRTGGNAFFLNRFLESLAEDDLLRFDRARESWHWDIEAIAARPVTENVVEFLAGRIAMLAPNERRCLSVASVIGDRFDLDVLSAATSASRKETLDALFAAIRADLVVPETDGFWFVAEIDEATTNFGWRFAHDRIRQAAHALIDPAEEQLVHLRVGRHLLERLGGDAPDQGVFDLVGHLETARAFLDANERARLEDLHIAAGRRALASAAFDAAHRAFSFAIAALEPTAWHERYERVLALHLDAARAAWLSGDRSAMEGLVARARDAARSTLDRVAMREIEIDALVGQQRFGEAVAAGLDVLDQLGVTFPDDPTDADVGAAVGAVLTALSDTSAEAIVALPAVTDRAVAQAVRIETAIMSSAYLARPRFFPLLASRIVSTTLREGITRQAPYAFAVFALVLNVIDHIDAGYRTGEIALQLLDRFDDRAGRARCEHVLFNQVKSYTEPLRPTVEAQLRVYRLGMDTGDLEYAAWALQCVCCNGFYAGLDLPDLATRMDRYLAIMQQHEQIPAISCSTPWRQLVRNLMGESANPRHLVGPDFDESERMTAHRATNFRGAACIVTTAGAFARYLFRDLEGALSWADAGGEFKDGAGSTYHVIWWHQYRALAHLGLDRPSSEIADSRERLATWCRFSPKNHQHRLDLVDAEIARVEGRGADAIALYDSASAHARANGFLHEQALANELAGRYFRSRGIELPARAYLAESVALWRRWGATAKAEHLQRELADLLYDANLGVPRGDRGPATTSTLTSTETSTAETSAGLDLESLFKAANVIAEEIHIERLPSRILEVAVQNAGATRGALILDHEGKLQVDASIAVGHGDSVAPGTPLAECPRLVAAIAGYVARSGRAVLLGDVRSDPRWQNAAPEEAVSVMCVPIAQHGTRAGALYLENDLVGGAFAPERERLIELLASQAAVSLRNAQLYENLERSLETQVRLTQAHRRFVPHPFLENLSRRDISEVTLGDSVRKEMSVLFADMRGFTRHVAGMTGSENIGFINRYLARMEPPVHRHGGFVDSYVGDAIMALFDQPDGAIQAAIGMSAALDSLNEGQRSPLECGFGIDTGELTLGTIGTEHRVKCGVIGDCVNVASRVESLTRLYGVPILTTERTARGLSRKYATRLVDRVIVKGHTEPVRILEIFDGDPDARREAKERIASDYESALELYRARDFHRAMSRFEACRAELPGDAVLGIHVARCQRYLAAPPPDDWDGVERLQHK